MYKSICIFDWLIFLNKQVPKQLKIFSFCLYMEQQMVSKSIIVEEIANIRRYISESS